MRARRPRYEPTTTETGHDDGWVVGAADTETARYLPWPDRPLHGRRHPARGRRLDGITLLQSADTRPGGRLRTAKVVLFCSGPDRRFNEYVYRDLEGHNEDNIVEIVD